VTPADPEACARAILDIHRRPEAARAKAKRARERLEAFRWELQVERYLGLLERLTGGPVPAPGQGRLAASEERP
jgi:glycosyltransferase involved in cell wall biosynthesis